MLSFCVCQSAALPPVILCKTGEGHCFFFFYLDLEGRNEREACAVNKEKRATKPGRGGCPVSGIHESGRTKCVFQLVGRNSGLSMFLSLLQQEAEDSLDAGPGPGVGVCIQEEVVSWVITWK